MENFRKLLPLAIEIISVASAMGIVFSVLVYSFFFGREELSYTGIASLADMLRDAMQALIIAIMSVTASVALIALNEYSDRSYARGRTYSIRQIIFRALKYGVVCACLFALMQYVSSVIAAKTLPAEVPWELVLLYSLAALLLVTVFYYAFARSAGYFGEHGRGKKFIAFDRSIIGIFVLNAVFSVSSSISSQVQSGLKAVVAPADSEICNGKYNIVWIGDSKMVVRCDKEKKLQVVLLN